MGSASRSLSGNQANKVVFNGSPSEYSGPQSAKPGLFSAGEPPPFLHKLQVLWQVLAVLSRDDGMEEEEAGEGVLELLVPSHLLGNFLLNRCLLQFFWV